MLSTAAAAAAATAAAANCTMYWHIPFYQETWRYFPKMLCLSWGLHAPIDMLPPSPACATVCFCMYSHSALFLVSAHPCSFRDAAQKCNSHYPSFTMLQPLPLFLYRL